MSACIFCDRVAHDRGLCWHHIQHSAAGLEAQLAAAQARCRELCVRLESLDDLVCEAAPLSWAAEGPPAVAAYAWEKRWLEHAKIDRALVAAVRKELDGGK